VLRVIRDGNYGNATNRVDEAKVTPGFQFGKEAPMEVTEITARKQIRKGWRLEDDHPESHMNVMYRQFRRQRKGKGMCGQRLGSFGGIPAPSGGGEVTLSAFSKERTWVQIRRGPISVNMRP
jgi:hypothetical protein